MSLKYEGRHYDTFSAPAAIPEHGPRHSRSYERFAGDHEDAAEAPIASPDAARNLARTAVAAEQGGRHRRYESFSSSAIDPTETPADPETHANPAGTGRRYEGFANYPGTVSVPAATAEAVPAAPNDHEAPVAPPATPEARARTYDVQTFEEAERVRRVFSDRTIIQMLNGELSQDANAQPGGPDLKRWADRVPAPGAEVDLARDPARIARLHARTADMIRRNQGLILDFSIAGDPAARGHIHALRREYDARLAQDDGTRLEQSIHKWDRDRKQAREVSHAMAYPQLVVATSKGEINVTDRFGEAVKGVRPLISLQEDVGGTYVHWFTTPFAKEAVENGHTTKQTHRIYLSPSPDHGPEVFEEIMTALDARALKVVGKLFDRTAEAVTNHRSVAEGENLTSRAEGIVLAMNTDEADEVLKIARGIVEKKRAVFAGRPVPKMALPIGDGMGVGAEPVELNESLTGHRLGVLNSVIEEVRASLHLKSGEKVQAGAFRSACNIFRGIWRHKALENGVNPDNMSFNV